MNTLGISKNTMSHLGIFETPQRQHKTQVLVLGAGEHALNLMKIFTRQRQQTFELKKFVQLNAETDKADNENIVSLEGHLFDYARANKIDEIVVAVQDRHAGLSIDELLQCKLEGISVIDMVTFVERELAALG